MPSQTASALGEKGTVSPVITSPSGSQPGPQTGYAVRVSAIRSLEEFWADWANQDFLRVWRVIRSNATAGGSDADITGDFASTSNDDVFGVFYTSC
jgi:hypothetical protein